MLIINNAGGDIMKIRLMLLVATAVVAAYEATNIVTSTHCAGAIAVSGTGPVMIVKSYSPSPVFINCYGPWFAEIVQECCPSQLHSIATPGDIHF